MKPPTRVLIVDEEPQIGRLFRDILDSNHYEVHSATSENEAAVLLTEPFDLLVLHRRLPHVSCENLVRAARQHREPAVVLLSSEKSREAERNMLLLGAAEILYKPLNPFEVRACVERNRQPKSVSQELLGGPRILVVDDDEMVLRSVQDILRKREFTVEGTASPYRALEILRDAPYEILLTDLMMEELSGIDLIRAALNSCPGLQAIVMTGYASKETAIAALKEGAYDFLEKPLTPEVVRQTVTRAWKAQRYQIENRRLLTALRHQLAEKEQLLAELELKSTEIEQFTYTVSHDLKSPVVTIQGFLGLLRKDLEADDVDRVEQDLDRIAGAAHSIDLLLEELLRLSRAGRRVDPPEEMGFGALAEDASTLAEHALTGRNIEVDIAPDLPAVYGERARLLEVLVHLFDNAAKFIGDQPAPRIEIGMQSNENEPVFYVRDNGIGIAPKYHQKIFGLFDQLDADTPGTGIGLTLTQRIIEVHRGRVWVESEGAGRGSTFYFTLAQGGD